VIPSFPSRGITQSIPPHRSYRNIPFSWSALAWTIPAAAVVELVVILIAQPALDAMSWFAAFIARLSGIHAQTYADPFLFVTLHPMTYDMRHIDWHELLVVIVSCALIVASLSVWTGIAAPMRFFINLNALLVGGAALFLLLTGHLGYDSAAFSQLMLRTALLTWLVIPIFVGFFASLFPFRPVERIGFIAMTVAWDIPLSIVRYACFIAILGQTGAIAMTDLYFLFGPLLDVVPVICFLSVLLVRLARALETRRAAWGLS
jgi:hypothetical protein